MCRISNLINVKLQAAEDYQLVQRSGGGEIVAMDKDEHYKDPGIAEARCIADPHVNIVLKETVKDYP